MHRYRWVVVVSLLCYLMACRLNPTIFRNAAQEQAFRTRYIEQPWLTAMVLRPYHEAGGYLIDLIGQIAEEEFATYRTAEIVPLGTPLRITGFDDAYLLARIDGYAEAFRILLSTTRGTVDEVGRELSILLTKTPPLPAVRSAFRSFVARQEIKQGMSWREVYMSWGRPEWP